MDVKLISIENGAMSHFAFFKQHLESNIVFFDIFYGAKRIELHKGGNTKPKVLMKLLVWEKSRQEIIILFYHILIGFKKDGIKGRFWKFFKAYYLPTMYFKGEY
jgi:hypothetical protein